MGPKSVVVLAAFLTAAIGPRAGSEVNEGRASALEDAAERAMAARQLNPHHYEARRAAQVVPLYLNTRHGSPFRLFGLQTVHAATVEDVGDSGRRYQLEMSVQEIITETTEKCSAEVFFPGEGKQPSPPQVKVSPLTELLRVDAKAEEEALYQRYRTKDPPLSAQYLPDSHGRLDPDMKPFWHLCIVASSFVMLSESTEGTLYNMAQVASITQLPTENEQLKFDGLVLLHDMVSQEIPRWKLLFTWSPAGGVTVLQMEQQPRCPHC
ncbi:latexin [Kryptolebias marmoratus]|uniref:Latexin n=1 Tax=Kryptolebias marmoratus TaxID=37003 RepID=A0A3Q3BF98_KRYMA|nr:latexin [Kryptolebias marmoratus]